MAMEEARSLFHRRRGMVLPHLGFTGPVSSGTGTECVPAWIWWGFTCKNGTVTANQSRGGYTSSVLGGTVGAGFTIKVGELSYRIYIEPTPYAPTQKLAPICWR